MTVAPTWSELLGRLRWLVFMQMRALRRWYRHRKFARRPKAVHDRIEYSELADVERILRAQPGEPIEIRSPSLSIADMSRIYARASKTRLYSEMPHVRRPAGYRPPS